MDKRISKDKECKIHGVCRHFKRTDENGYRCSTCANEAVERRRRKIKHMSIEYKGGQCQRCSYNKCVSALTFHHIDPKQKDFGIAHKGYTRSWNKVKEELDKCMLLCQNCHAEEHEKMFNANNKQLDERLNTFIIKKRKNKRKIKYCIDCNKEIQGKNKCKECYIKTKPTKIEWPTTNELIEMVKQSSYVSVGKKLGVSDNAVRKRIIKHS